MTETAAPAPATPTVPLPTIGRVVLFTFKGRDGSLVTRAGIVCNVGPLGSSPPWINLRLFHDGTNDIAAPSTDADGISVPGALPDVLPWVTSVTYSAEAAERTWRWMDYQMGQAKQSQDVAGALTARVAALERRLAAAPFHI